MRPVAITGDLKQAFLQILIRDEDRDALRFHWIKDRNSTEIEVHRFTRLVFGLGPSPFVLGGTIESHLDKEHQNHPEAVEELRKSLYIDDVISGDDETGVNDGFTSSRVFPKIPDPHSPLCCGSDAMPAGSLVTPTGNFSRYYDSISQ